MSLLFLSISLPSLSLSLLYLSSVSRLSIFLFLFLYFSISASISLSLSVSVSMYVRLILGPLLCEVSAPLCCGSSQALSDEGFRLAGGLVIVIPLRGLGFRGLRIRV